MAKNKIGEIEITELGFSKENVCYKRIGCSPLQYKTVISNDNTLKQFYGQDSSKSLMLLDPKCLGNENHPMTTVDSVAQILSEVHNSLKALDEASSPKMLIMPVFMFDKQYEFLICAIKKENKTHFIFTDSMLGREKLNTNSINISEAVKKFNETQSEAEKVTFEQNENKIELKYGDQKNVHLLACTVALVDLVYGAAQSVLKGKNVNIDTMRAILHPEEANLQYTFNKMNTAIYIANEVEVTNDKANTGETYVAKSTSGQRRSIFDAIDAAKNDKSVSSPFK